MGGGPRKIWPQPVDIAKPRAVDKPIAVDTLPPPSVDIFPIDIGPVDTVTNDLVDRKAYKRAWVAQKRAAAKAKSA